jgi:hypothetical protein
MISDVDFDADDLADGYYCVFCSYSNNVGPSSSNLVRRVDENFGGDRRWLVRSAGMPPKIKARRDGQGDTDIVL